MFRVGQNRTYAPYMTIYLVIFLPETLYLHHTYIYYIYMVLANFIHTWQACAEEGKD